RCPNRMSAASLFLSCVLVFGFLRVVLVPLGDFDDEILRAVRHALAAEARLRGYAGRFVELVQLSVRRFVAGVEALMNDHVARGASAHSAACMIEGHLVALRNVENASRQAVVAIRNFVG